MKKSKLCKQRNNMEILIAYMLLVASPLASVEWRGNQYNSLKLHNFPKKSTTDSHFLDLS